MRFKNNPPLLWLADSKTRGSLILKTARYFYVLFTSFLGLFFKLGCYPVERESIDYACVYALACVGMCVFVCERESESKRASARESRWIIFCFSILTLS